MASSAEQIHHGGFAAEPSAGGDLRLFVDLDVCASGECGECRPECSYFYHPENNGIASIAELATYALVCRKCENPHCVAACPVDALEQREEQNRMLVRHNMRCVGCRSCSHACPYGTIYPETVPLLVHNCDFCLDRRDEDPLCVRTCTGGALAVRSADGELPENTFLVGENLIVHSTHWMREQA
jgi:Fe-S-cluster-containing dehydrogenase component